MLALPFHQPGQAPLNVIGKSVIDFLAAVPLISVSFVAIDAALNDSTPGDIFDKMKSSWKIPGSYIIAPDCPHPALPESIVRFSRNV